MIEYKIKADEVIMALSILIDKGVRLNPALAEIGKALIESTKKRFDSGIAPDGSRWAKNSPVTIDRKGHSKPLIGETGLLQDQINYFVASDGSELIISSPLEYAAMQQFGGSKSEFGHLWGDIPARPFLGISAEDEAEMIKILEDYFDV